MGGKSGTKAVYFDKLKALLDEYKSIFIASRLPHDTLQRKR